MSDDPLCARVFAKDVPGGARLVGSAKPKAGVGVVVKGDVVVVSGEAGAAERWRFGILGVREFVEKPVDLEALVARIRGVGERLGLIRRAEPA